MRNSLLLQLIGPALLVVNAVWYGAKFFLRSKGYQASWFSRHGADFKNLAELAAKGASETDRRAAGRWLLALRVAVGIFVVAAFSFLLSVWIGGVTS